MKHKIRIDRGRMTEQDWQEFMEYIAEKAERRGAQVTRLPVSGVEETKRFQFADQD